MLWDDKKIGLCSEHKAELLNLQPPPPRAKIPEHHLQFCVCDPFLSHEPHSSWWLTARLALSPHSCHSPYIDIEKLRHFSLQGIFFWFCIFNWTNHWIMSTENLVCIFKHMKLRCCRSLCKWKKLRCGKEWKFQRGAHRRLQGRDTCALVALLSEIAWGTVNFCFPGIPFQTKQKHGEKALWKRAKETRNFCVCVNPHRCEWWRDSGWPTRAAKRNFQNFEFTDLLNSVSFTTLCVQLLWLANVQVCWRGKWIVQVEGATRQHFSGVFFSWCGELSLVVCEDSDVNAIYMSVLLLLRVLWCCRCEHSNHCSFHVRHALSVRFSVMNVQLLQSSTSIALFVVGNIRSDGR